MQRPLKYNEIDWFIIYPLGLRQEKENIQEEKKKTNILVGLFPFKNTQVKEGNTTKFRLRKDEY